MAPARCSVRPTQPARVSAAAWRDRFEYKPRFSFYTIDSSVKTMPIIINAQSIIEPIDIKVCHAKHFQFFKNGREAFVAGLIQRRVDKSCPVIFPSFYCVDVLQSVVNAGFKIIVSNINQKYEYDIVELESIVHNKKISAIVVVDFFGWKNNQINDILQKYGPKSILIIRDCCHSPFTWDGSKSAWEIAVFSWRKTIAVPDGGVLFNNEFELSNTGLKNLNNNIFKYTVFYFKRRFKSLLLRTHRAVELLNKIQFKSNVYEVFLNGGVGKSESPKSVKPSKYLLQALANNIEIEKIKLARRKNFEKICSGIQDLDILVPRFSFLSHNDFPYVVPLNVKDVVGTMRYLGENGIQSIIWPIVQNYYSISSIAKKCCRATVPVTPLVCIPVNQEITDVDLCKIVFIIRRRFEKIV